MRVILASKSPRRREILSSLGISFEVITPDVEEKVRTTHPMAMASQLALTKALAVKDRLAQQGAWDEQTLIIAADTIVVKGDAVLGKPRDAEDAKRMLRLLSDTEHEVMSGIALVLGSTILSATDCTKVSFAEMSEEQIDWYVASGEPMDKAGAYAVQGLASMWINGLHGCYFNVVGLPVRRMQALLSEGLGMDMKELCRQG